MKEIEDIIEYLKTFDSYSDTGAFDEEIKGLMVGSKQLLETVESLKSCGNCKIGIITYDGLECQRTRTLRGLSYSCKYWVKR